MYLLISYIYVLQNTIGRSMNQLGTSDRSMKRERKKNVKVDMESKRFRFSNELSSRDTAKINTEIQLYKKKGFNS